ncbi:TetR/AcrR family transcriptional regulator [Streptomyces sp. NBC_00536]|uniref:TetR/AcrR family transcriptional regulator n=1 Tax=Streptomyces sp. NBC_00536 TaxID=2975769 RepID=UPI002E7FD94E|nr:TetR/AcrR family transcriptional regulator [Streptomyces sp. NBC_00536]WUC83352.1 TetR/AcrR family transcriptional regulator [Streptomyces sp. NBC_00536]
MGPASASSRRERTRAATVEEIKRTALTLMRESGAADVRFTDIARAMGLTPPALYRYFADRDELLTALVADSFNSLSEALIATRDAVPADDLGARLLATCSAYRSWALGDPQRFALIFGVPVPGYTAPPDGPTVEAGQRAISHLASLVLDTERLGRLGDPLVAPATSQFLESAAERLAPFEGAVRPQTYQALMLSWSAVHGFVSLEAYGHFGWADQATRDQLFTAQVRMAAGVAGLVPPEA